MTRLEWERSRTPIDLSLPESALFRQLCQSDLFFLLRYALQRRDTDNDFVFQRCRDVQEEPDEHLDLWARLHYKSTVITYALTIQDILNDPENTIAIFSHTKGTANKFFRQIKWELESNEWLKGWFSDILWQDVRQSPLWDSKDGLIVQRKSNPKEATLSAWGLVDKMPTGGHFSHRVYDDVVEPGTVTTPEMIEKATSAYKMSQALRTDGGVKRIIGTRYHFNDPYAGIIKDETATPRIHVATKDGEVEGEPILLKRQTLADMRKEMGPYIFGCQMMQDPRADSAMGFRDDWLQFFDREPVEAAAGANIYILGDPASEKKKHSDRTCLWVWALAPDGNMYWVDGVLDRLNLKQRGDALFALVRKWQPITVGYEKIGLQADTEYFCERMETENYRFSLQEVGGTTAKNDRIRRLVPDFGQHRVWMPQRMLKMTAEGQQIDLVRIFLDEEYRAFPVSAHDDMLDAASRIKDLSPIFPRPQEAVPLGGQVTEDLDYNPYEEA